MFDVILSKMLKNVNAEMVAKELSSRLSDYLAKFPVEDGQQIVVMASVKDDVTTLRIVKIETGEERVFIREILGTFEVSVLVEKFLSSGGLSELLKGVNNG